MKLIATASALALSAAPVLAGGLTEPQPTPEPVAVTPVAPVVASSLWSGGYVGAQAGYAWAEADDADDEGPIGGLHGGYLWNSGKFVYGIEGDYDWADVEFGDAGSLDSIGRIKAKAGYDLGRTLLYATAGGAYADAEIGGDSYSDWGWVAGAGVDYMVTDAWSVGAEALYHKFDDFDDSGADLSGTTLTAKVAYHF
ncbi:outer membrane protein [Qingshengfaniella alkalisoli]|uniref:Porin family protein n=1 Tax=Qingshengfaniella alkalisoli TaxID=2599296 RepID=A0A5B8J6N6_9RHOB|nr:outer membrane beta-barrel protein [Qingshengfaniella alkalisoli]QDY70000.1 porin family protein [Qingshengfaniella alkalisoli]